MLQNNRFDEIAVVTATLGQRDELRHDQNTEGARFLAYVDRPYASPVWEERPAITPFHSPRRNSRLPKILIHQFCNAEYSIWIDASMAIKVPARTIVDDLLRDADMALFRHESRVCTFAEGLECASRELDDPALIHAQMDRYRSKGLPASVGLARCSMMVRRHSEKVEAFNNSWWAEYSCYSVRDQLSFMFAARSANLTINYIPDSIYSHPYFSIQPRPAQREPRMTQHQLAG